MKKYIYAFIIVLIAVALVAIFYNFKSKDKNYYTNSLLVKSLEVDYGKINS